MNHQEYQDAQRMEAEAHDAMLAIHQADLVRTYAQAAGWICLAILALAVATKVVIG